MIRFVAAGLLCKNVTGPVGSVAGEPGAQVGLLKRFGLIQRTRVARSFYIQGLILSATGF